MTVPDRAKLKSRNLELFKRCTPARVYERLKAVEPKWQLAFDDDGNPGLLDGGRPVMGPGSDAAAEPGGIRAGSVIRFTAEPPNRNWIDVHTFDFLDATLRRATAEGIPFFENPVTPVSYYLIVFGAGLGRHLPPLVEMTKCRHVIIVEPDLEFIWHSLETFDWIDFIGGVQEKGGDVEFILADNPSQISGNLWRTIKRTNPCLSDGFVCCVHHHAEMVREVIDTLRHEASLITSELGFFYDETLMLWNVYCNLIGGEGAGAARLYGRTPEVERGVPAFVVGSGPSLDASLDVIRKHADHAVIIACGSALRPLVLNGIVPDFQMEIENLEVTPLVAQVADAQDLSGVCILASSTVDPDAIAPFGETVFYFRYSLSPFPLFCETDAWSLEMGGPTVVNSGLAFAQEAGFRDIYLFGVDMGAKDPEYHHARDSFHYTDAAQPRDVSEFRIPVDANFGGDCLTTLGLYSARVGLIDAIGRHAQGRRYFNCSDGAAIDGAAPLRPADVTLAAADAAKEAVVAGIIGGFATVEESGIDRTWPGGAIEKDIGAYMDRVAKCLGEVIDFKDKSYSVRLMELFRPNLGYVEAPPRDTAQAVNFLFRGTLMAMLVFFEHFLARVAEHGKINRFGEIGREELLVALDGLKAAARERLAGKVPKAPPPFSEITAAAGRTLPPLPRIPRNESCPCGSGRKYKHCHGAVG